MYEQNTKQKIDIGYRFGHLVVTEDSGKRKNGYTVWKCVCVCGNEICLDTRYIQRGTITDCGCISLTRPGQIDVTGMRYGMLLCLHPTDERDSSGNTLWQCQCDCGNICMASIGSLRAGYKKSCGCLSHPPLKDFVGKRFGSLTVTEYAGKRDGMHRWKCVCNCGKETIVGQTLLQSGKTKSCGCLQASVIYDNLKLCEGTSVTLLEARKKHPARSNTSGYTGVYRNKRTGLWAAQITFKGKTYYLGSYAKIEDAVKARQRGEEMHDEFLEWYHREFRDTIHNAEGETDGCGNTKI